MEVRQPHANVLKSQVLPQKEAPKREEIKQEPEAVQDTDIAEKGDGYVVRNLRQKQSGIKQAGTMKMSRTYVYDGLEIFATRFSPDDTCLAVGTPK